MLMGAGSLKSRGQQDRAPPAASRKESFLAPSSFRWWLGILGVHWLVGAPLQALPHVASSSPVCLFPAPSCRDTGVDPGPTLIGRDLSFTYIITPAETPFPNKITF